MISKQDLSNFLEKELKIQSDRLSSTNIDRLYKLMDFSKKGFIYKSDLQRVLSVDGKSWENNDEWLANAKQQLGLYLSKEFQGLKQSFESNFI